MINVQGYKILDRVYDGSQTLLFRAEEQKKGKKTVVIKLLKERYPNPRHIKRLKHEFHIAGLFDFDGIIKPCESLDYANGPAVVYEDFGGDSLTLCFKDKNPELKEFFEIAIQFANSLAHIHDKGVIHKDIHPGNVIYNRKTGKLKITDFGLSMLYDKEKQTAINPEGLEGNLNYISPEQTGRTNRFIDYRTDIYSLGATFYHLLTGRLPFTAEDPMALVHAHIAQMPEPPHKLRDGVPVKLSELILKLMAKDAESRYQSADSLKQDIIKIRDAWAKNQDISNLELDIPGRRKFEISDKLYGRENEIDQLLESMQRAVSGSRELLIVDGFAGVGKSSLIQELQKPVVNNRGFFISGKFDQFNRNVPYESILTAFQELIRNILSGGETTVAYWRDKLHEKIGNNLSVITDVLPELELITGEPDEIQDLNAEEANYRFKKVMRQFVSVFATKEHPLVLFLDDLQWADQGSLSLMELLLTDEKLSHILIVVVYRDNELGTGHPTKLAITELKQKKVFYQHIHLEELGSEHINLLVSNALKQPDENTKKLTSHIMTKTRGNPFFVIQFLKALYSRGYIFFDEMKDCWSWDDKKVRLMQLSDDVVDLMAENLKQLKEETRKILSLAACVGNQFDVMLLAELENREPVDLAKDLLPAIKNGFVIPLNSELRNIFSDQGKAEKSPDEVIMFFSHDRIQQAANSLISEEEQSENHLKIGRYQIQHYDYKTLNENFFDVVNHLNTGYSRIDSDNLRQKVARLNIQAGNKAKSASAYKDAVLYYDMALKTIADDVWTEDYETIFSFCYNRAECLYVLQESQKATSALQELLKTAKTDIHKLRIYRGFCKIDMIENKYEKIITDSRKYLKAIGEKCPENPNMQKMQIVKELIRYKMLLRGKTMSDLENLPACTDPRITALIAYYHELQLPAYQVDQDYLGMTHFRIINLALKHGVDEHISYTFTTHGPVIMELFGKFSEGDEFARLGQKHLSKIKNELYYWRTRYVYNTLMQHWNHDAMVSLSDYREIYKNLVNLGDPAYAGLSVSMLLWKMYFMGFPLEEIKEEHQKYADYIRDYTDKQIKEPVGMILKNVKALQGNTRDISSHSYDDFDEQTWYYELKALKNNSMLVFDAATKISLKFFADDYEAVMLYSKTYEKLAPYLMGLYANADVITFQVASACRLLTSNPRSNNKKLRKIIKSGLKKLSVWETHCAENFAHKHHFAEAELKRLEGDIQGAIDQYRDVILWAGENNLHFKAAASEAIGACYRSLHREEEARMYIRQALFYYRQWNAEGKAEKLREQWPDVHENTMISEESTTFYHISDSPRTNTEYNIGTQLDAYSIVKASQAISGEILLDKLMERLLSILIENAGASNGLFVMNKGNELRIASRTVEKSTKKITIEDQKLEGSEDVPVSMIQFVARTGETVLVNKSEKYGRYQNDPYFSLYFPGSVLCLPVKNKDKLLGIVYLENTLADQAFNKNKLEIIEWLTGQIAISLENALLYERTVKLNADLRQEMTERKKSEDERIRIESENRRKAIELEEARAMQMAMFPDSMPVTDDFDVAASSIPATEVGGDYYDYFLNHDGSMLLVIGDASGHGLKAGNMVAITKSLLNVYANEPDLVKNMTDISRSIKQLNLRMMHMCLALVRVEKDGTVKMCGAAMPPVYHYKASENKLEEIEFQGMPLGSVLTSTYEMRTIRMDKDDCLYLLSDGLPELENPDNEQYGYEKLEELFVNTSGKTAADIIKHVNSESESWRKNRPQDDDISFLVMKKK